MDDEELARQLQAEEDAKVRKPRRSVTSTKSTGRKLSRKMAADGSVKKRRAPTNNPFNKPLLLSEPLSKLVGGAKQMSRPQVVKHIWAYVKEHGLQDPADKRILICDELMMPVMKKPRISCFAMNRVLSDHLFKLEGTTASPSEDAANEVDSEDDFEADETDMD